MRRQDSSPPAQLPAWRASAALVLIGMLAGCTTVPAPVALPALPAATGLAAAAAGSADRRPASAAALVARPAALPAVFDDPGLAALLQAARAHNTDLLQAAARVREARALQAATGAEARPAIGATAGAARNRGPDGEGGVRTASAFDARAELRWELDLFGRLARASDAAGEALRATEADRDGVAQAVDAAVTQAWADGRVALVRLEIAQSALVTQREALRLVEARQQAGRGTALDTERARALVAGTEATVPALQQQVVAARLRLATLTGRQVEVAAALPEWPSAATLAATSQAGAEGAGGTSLAPRLVQIDLSTVQDPGALLRQRPDLQAAEARAAAAGLDVEVARLAAYPRLTLTGLLGLDGARLADLGSAPTRVAGLGARLAWSGLDAGRAQAQVDAAAARRDAALVAWRGAVLVALEEAERALRAAASEREQLASLIAAEQAATRAAALARARFEAGVSDFLTVLDAERERLSASDRAALARGAAAASVIAVFRAFGGGFASAPGG